MKPLSGVILVSTLVFLISCGTVDPYKKYPHMVADADPVSAGTIEVQFDRHFSSKVNKAEIEIIFYPRLNAAALEFKYEFITHRQFWDETGRRQFVAALEYYQKDFADQNLINRYRKTKAIYGKVSGRTEWELFKYTKTHLAYPTIELGYRFREDMPFFATFMRSAREEDDMGDSSSRGDSQQINMYFTRAQADELVKLFDQAYLMGLLEIKDRQEPKPEEPPSATPYREYEGS